MICVVTDDAAHAQRLLGDVGRKCGVSFRIAGSDGALSDFERIRRAKYRIISNSTFSWWAAALSRAGGLTVGCDRWTQRRQRAYRLDGEILLNAA